MRNNRNFATTHTLMGALFFICALIFYYFSVLRIDYRDTKLLYLGYSDPAHYFAQAKALLKHELPAIQIGYDKLPSLWPVGYPALMLPWMKILPEADSILAPFRTNQTIGLLLLFGVFGFYLYLAMPLTGGFAALLLATLPGFFHFLSFATERHQRIGIRRASLYVCILGSEGGMPLENLPIGSISWTFREHSPAVDLLRAVVVGHGSVPSEGSARTLAFALSCISDCFRSGSQPAIGAKYDPVSFAT